MKAKNNSKYKWDLNLVLQKFGVVSVEELVKYEENIYIEFFGKMEDKNIEEESDLLTFLQELNRIVEDHSVLASGYYVSLALSTDTNSTEMRRLQNKIFELNRYIRQNLEKYKQKLIRLPEYKKIQILQNTNFKKYHHYLETLFSLLPHTLTEEAENVVYTLSKNAISNWTELTAKILSNSTKVIQLKINSKNNKKEYTFEELLDIASKDINKQNRNKAVYALNQIFDQLSPVIESEINNFLQYINSISQLRKYEYLEQPTVLKDKITLEYLNNLVDAVRNNYRFSHQYYKLKTKLLKTKKIKYNERSTPVGKVSKKYSFDTAIKLVREALLLDNEFLSVLDSMIENGQIDVYPNKGKVGGAFCSSWAKNLPAYILLNYTGSFNNVITLAHELGHAIHFFMCAKEQIGIYCNFSTAIAELASTFIEELVLEQSLLETLKTKEDKISAITTQIENIISAIHRQIAIYSFEKRLHITFKERGYLSLKDINNIFVEEMSAYLGPSVDMKGFEMFWMYIKHIRYLFYTYSYASGHLMSKILHARYRQNPESINIFKSILRKGNSDYVVNICKSHGLEVENKNFWDEGLQYGEKMLSELEELIK